MLFRLFIISIFGINYSTSLKCYSCGEENTSFHVKENLIFLPCDEMDKTENLETFIIECPEEYFGCVTQFKDKEIKRTCDTPAIDDCETANGITYCYCSQDLCNGKQSRIDAHKSLRDINYPSDDEDYMDMSGHGHTDTDDQTTTEDEHYNENNNFILNSSANKSSQFKYLVYASAMNTIFYILFFKRLLL